MNIPRTASVMALVNSDIFLIEKQDLDVILELFPSVKQQLMKIAVDRLKRAQERDDVSDDSDIDENSEHSYDDDSILEFHEAADPGELHERQSQMVAVCILFSNLIFSNL